MQIQFLHPFQINLPLNFKEISISGFYTIKKFWALNVQKLSTLLNKKGPKNESKGVSKMVSSYQKLATGTLSRNPKSRMETKIKISVSEGNVIVFPNKLTLDNFWIVITARTLSSTTTPGYLWISHDTCFSTIHFSVLAFISCSLQTKLWGESYVFSLGKPNNSPMLAFCLLHFLLTHASEAYFS